MIFCALGEAFKIRNLHRKLNRFQWRHFARTFVGTCHPTPPARRPVINYRVPKNPAVNLRKLPHFKPSLRSKPTEFGKSFCSEFPSSLTLTSTHKPLLLRNKLLLGKSQQPPLPPAFKLEFGRGRRPNKSLFKQAPAEVSDRHRTSFSSHPVIRCHRPTSPPVSLTARVGVPAGLVSPRFRRPVG